jgi:hypothetical protein
MEYMVGLKPIGSIARNWNPRSSNLVYKKQHIGGFTENSIGSRNF